MKKVNKGIVKKRPVGDSYYNLEFIEDLSDGESDGEFSESEKEIRIDASLKGEDRIITLLHEFFHAYYDSYVLRTYMTDEQEETIADTFPKTLVKNFNITLKKNPS